MKALDVKQAKNWCEERGVKVTEKGWLYFESHDRRSITVGLPKEPHQLVYLTNLFIPYDESTPLEGALLWIRDWGIWNEMVERVGFRTIEVMRRLTNEARSITEVPAYIFDKSELVDLQVCLLQPLLVGWDAFLVPVSADYIVAVSHDSLVSVIGRTSEGYTKMLSRFGRWGALEDNWYFRGSWIPAER
jgi:hypothetical protein